VHKSVQYTYLFHFSTCLGHPCAPHQGKITETMRRWSAGWSE